MKRIFLTVVVCVCLALTAFAAPAKVSVSDGEVASAAVLASEAGEGLTWSLNGGVLTISGKGDMNDWQSVENTPWYSEMASISEIVIEDGVTSIGSNAFYAEGATEIEVEDKDLFFVPVASGTVSGITWEMGDNGCLYLSGDGELYDFANADAVPWKSYRSSIEKVSVGYGITYIGAYSFYGCSGISSVLIPEKVESIGRYAFANCSSLEYVVFENVVDAPGNAFDACPNLLSIGFGSYDCYKEMTEDAEDIYDFFIGDKKVVEVNIPASVSEIGEGALDAFYPVIVGYPGSFAKTYAENKGYKFISKGVKINLGAKAASTNVRYVEIDGNQYLVEENGDNTYEVSPTKNMLVEITEKTSEDSAFAVSTKYYYVDSETLEYYELFSLGSFMNNKDSVSVRTANPVSLRFKAYVSSDAKRETEDFVIEEYGFIIGTRDLLDKTGKQLNFEFDNYVSGVAYNRADGTDIVYDARNDDEVVFTGILKNIPAKHYATEVVSKTYTKVKVGSDEFVVYGEPLCASMYETALAILDSGENLGDEQKATLQKIVDTVVPPNESKVPSDGLFD